MLETPWKIVLLFGLTLGLATGKPTDSFYRRKNVESALISNELDDRTSNSSRNLRFGDQERYREGRLSEAEFSSYNIKDPNGPGTYAFGYDNVVDAEGNEQFRNEEKLRNGTVLGEYGYTDYKSKRIVRVTYSSDIRGYRAKTEVLPLDDIY
ncbi:uncharacterized protein LOC124310556 [Neodiprion virginianus]|uniref:uncharacterized protein LOC124310556 n=1 Tax=Neodiprion virginianus TaxID=2961670 RepID=UPI001EE6B709|nr:uncharacterized protein LOC124310556 [Neodiprion virginianus]